MQCGRIRRSQDLLYAATEKAVWVSFDDGEHWRPLQYNLPHTSMRDLLVKDNDLIVATHGRAFWIMDDVSPLRQMAATGNRNGSVLLRQRAAWRVRRDTNTDTPLPADEPAGENPPDGAIFDYALAKVAQSVTLEILDKAENVLRKYSSDDPAVPTPEELRTGIDPRILAKDAWTVAHGCRACIAGCGTCATTAPTATSYSYPIAAVPHRTPLVPQGPLVVPGTYTVRLTVDGKSETQTVLVKMDPRVHLSQTELEALYSAQTTMANSLDELAKADLQAHSVMEQVEAVNDPASGQRTCALQCNAKDHSEGTGPNATKRLPGIDEVTAEATLLYGELEQADANPNAALLAAAAHVQT